VIWIHAGAGNLRDLTPETQDGMRVTEKVYKKLFNEALYVTHMQAGK